MKVNDNNIDYLREHISTNSSCLLCTCVVPQTHGVHSRLEKQTVNFCSVVDVTPLDDDLNHMYGKNGRATSNEIEVLTAREQKLAKAKEQRRAKRARRLTIDYNRPVILWRCEEVWLRRKNDNLLGD